MFLKQELSGDWEVGWTLSFCGNLVNHLHICTGFKLEEYLLYSHCCTSLLFYLDMSVIITLISLMVPIIDDKVHCRCCPQYCKSICFKVRLLQMRCVLSVLVLLLSTQCVLDYSISPKQELARFSHKLLVSLWNFEFLLT